MVERELAKLLRGLEIVKKQGNPTVFQSEIILGRETVVPYTVNMSLRAKNVRLSVGLGTGLQIVIPTGYRLGEVESILKGKEKWILHQLKLAAETLDKRNNAREDLTSVLRYLGKEYHVVTVISAQSPIRVELEGEKAFVTMPETGEQLLRKVLEAWYLWAARELFEDRVKSIAAKMNVTYRSINIKNQKTRWGSCSSKRNLNFNMRVVMAPPEIVDYLVVHELAHLKEMNHSIRFWNIVDAYCPNRKLYQKWLKEHGPSLIL